MNRILHFIFMLSSFSTFSQIEDAWVYFNNKPNSATYLNNPLTMLTQRALDRRTAQNISLNINDVPIYQPYIDQISNISGITILAKSKWLNCIHVRGQLSNILSIRSLSFVNHVYWANNSLNKIANNTKPFLPVNKKFAVATSFNYGNSGNQIMMLNGHLLHQQNYTGTGKVIAVLDSGFPNVDIIAPFQRIMANNQILGGYDFVNKRNNFFTGHYHGTYVLSCMAGYVDNQLVGTAPDASYYLYITEDVNSENPVEESNWVEAAEEADRVGADIITTSLGYFEYDNSTYSHLYSDMTGDKNFASRGANIAFSKGIVVVASAGNTGLNIEPHIGVPAEATNVLAVGAVQFNRNYASFSSVGPSFDGRIKPDVMAQGQSIVLSNTLGNIVVANGTSFSCPLMAGLIASFWQAFPTLTNQQVINFIKTSSDRFLQPNTQYGYGIPNFQMALDMVLSTNPISSIVFELYQNLDNSMITLIFTNNYKNLNFKLYSILGNKVLEKKIEFNYTNIDISNLSSGIYIYKIESNGVQKIGKIAKK